MQKQISIIPGVLILIVGIALFGGAYYVLSNEQDDVDEKEKELDAAWLIVDRERYPNGTPETRAKEDEVKKQEEQRDHVGYYYYLAFLGPIIGVVVLVFTIVTNKLRLELALKQAQMRGPPPPPRSQRGPPPRERGPPPSVRSSGGRSPPPPPDHDAYAEDIYNGGDEENF